LVAQIGDDFVRLKARAPRQIGDEDRIGLDRVTRGSSIDRQIGGRNADVTSGYEMSDQVASAAARFDELGAGLEMREQRDDPGRGVG
jgi:hypothetical protein